MSNTGIKVQLVASFDDPVASLLDMYVCDVKLPTSTSNFVSLRKQPPTDPKNVEISILKILPSQVYQPELWATKYTIALYDASSLYAEDRHRLSFGKEPIASGKHIFNRPYKDNPTMAPWLVRLPFRIGILQPTSISLNGYRTGRINAWRRNDTLENSVVSAINEYTRWFDRVANHTGYDMPDCWDCIPIGENSVNYQAWHSHAVEFLSLMPEVQREFSYRY